MGYIGCYEVYWGCRKRFLEDVGFEECDIENLSCFLWLEYRGVGRVDGEGYGGYFRDEFKDIIRGYLLRVYRRFRRL